MSAEARMHIAWIQGEQLKIKEVLDDATMRNKIQDGEITGAKLMEQLIVNKANRQQLRDYDEEIFYRER